jgi:hypothetical protein
MLELSIYELENQHGEMLPEREALGCWLWRRYYCHDFFFCHVTSVATATATASATAIASGGVALTTADAFAFTG